MLSKAMDTLTEGAHTNIFIEIYYLKGKTLFTEHQNFGVLSTIKNKIKTAIFLFRIRDLRTIKFIVLKIYLASFLYLENCIPVARPIELDSFEFAYLHLP